MVGALLLLRPDGHGQPAGGLEPEAHHRLVDRADLLHVEGAVRDALAVEHQQLVECAVDGAVGDERRLDPLVDLARAGAPAFEERKAVRVEQRAVAPRQAQPVGVGAVVEQAEQHQELRPSAVALVHRVGVQRGVLAQALVQAGERVVAHERLAVRQQVALLGVEQEHEAQDDGEQGVVDVVGAFGQRRAQQRAVRQVIGGLEAAEQLVEGVQHLLRQPLAHRVLVAPAVVEERGEALVARQAQEAGLPEEEPERGHHGAAGGGDHVRHVQIEPAGALAARRGHEAERAAVEQQAGRDAGLAQQPLQPAVRRNLQAAGPASGEIEVLAGVEHAHQQLPARRVLARVALAHREVGTQQLAAVVQRHLQLGGDWVAVRARVAPG